LLDLDYTAFRTDIHFRDFCNVMKDSFDIDVDTIKEHEHRITEKPAPYSPLDDIRYNPADSELDVREILRIAEDKLKTNGLDYLYEDVKPFLQEQMTAGNRIVLITVGTHEYQQHKQRLAPSLQELPMLVTRDTKANLLHRSLSSDSEGRISLSSPEISVTEAEEVVLIDDRAGTFKEPMPKLERLSLVRLRRPGVPHSETPTPAGIREITSLNEW